MALSYLAAISKGVCTVCEENAYGNCLSVQGLNNYVRTAICEKCYETVRDDLNTFGDRVNQNERQTS